EVDGALPQVEQSDLAFDQVLPGRRKRVLEVRHEHFGAGVERIDDHLALRRAGDLDAAVLQVGGYRRHLPVAFADVLRLGDEIGKLAGVVAGLYLLAAGKQPLALAVEAAMQAGDELQGSAGQDPLPSRQGPPGDRNTARKIEI